MSTQDQLDPYSAKALVDNVSPQEKLEGFHSILSNVKTGMLTTRSPDGSLHSRAMVPAGPLGPNQVSLVFIANNATYKCEEIQNDSHVNVAFYDHSSTSWVSYSGSARISQDKEKIACYWSTPISAWFGDLGDGIHKGDKNDPRIALIEVNPDEIRYWIATKGTVGRALDVAKGAVTGKAAAPGELRTISQDEIQLIQALHSKAE